MKKALQQLIDTLAKSETLLAGSKVTAGFDGFVDRIQRVIIEKNEQKGASYFRSIKEFGNYITGKESSFSLEVETISDRIGGNMPIMANALAHIGAAVNCVGALGHPVLHHVFAALSSNCRVYSFAEPGFSTAYEFNDGKILLGENGQLNTAGWEQVKNKIGLDTLRELYSSSDLICLVNWSEIDASTDIWKGLLRDVLPTYEKKQTAFFDLSDCSKRSKQAIHEAIMLLKEFSKHCAVTLGLNNNEARLIYQIFFQNPPPTELAGIGEMIFEKIGVEKLVLHSSKQAIGCDSNGVVAVPGFFIETPVISTGAGDNFNAGFCAGQLLQLDMQQSLLLANAVAAYYVSSGKNGNLQDCVKFLQHAAQHI